MELNKQEDIVLSWEQWNIITAVQEGKNLIVDAVAGSGKTTTLLAIAAFCSSKRILMLTYNAFLKEEVRQRALDYSNLEVHSYHALAASYFPFVPTKGYDRALRLLLEKQFVPKRILPPFDLIFIDECQDMRPLYFDFIRYFVTCLIKNATSLEAQNPQIVLCGDRHQEMYAYLGADRRYLTLGSEVLEALGSKHDLQELSLSRSYRLTNSMSSFLNQAVLGQTRVQTDKEGAPVSYLEINPYQAGFYLENFISKIGSHIDPGHVFVLAPSVKTKCDSAIMALERYFCARSIPVFLAEHDIKSNTLTSQGKVEFTTFHRAKGRERPYVIVFGFDTGYFDFFGKDYSQDTVPDTLYVALTRSSKWLAVISDRNYKALEFLQKDCLINEKEICQSIVESTPEEQKQSNKCVYCSNRNPASSITDFIKHLPERLLDSLIDPVEQLFVEVTSSIYSTRLATEIPQVSSKGKTYYENVAALNGIAIPEMWEFLQKGSSAVHSLVEKEYANIIKGNFRSPVFRSSKFLTQIEEVLNYDFTPVSSEEDLNIAAHLHLCNVYYSICNGTLSNLYQIRKYDWLDLQICRASFKLLETFLFSSEKGEEKDILKFEKEVCLVYPYTCFCGIKRKFRLSGRIDVLSDTLWELKVSKELNIMHRLQVLLYALATSFKYGAYHLLNLRDGSLIFFPVTFAGTQEVWRIFQTIFEHRYLSLLVRPDDQLFKERLHRDLTLLYSSSEEDLKYS